jgi:multidrug resistance efflux pump
MRLIILIVLTLFLCSCDNESSRYNGYIDADPSNSAGRLNELLVKRGEQVHTNQLLFKVEQVNNKFAVEISKLNQKKSPRAKERTY